MIVFFRGKAATGKTTIADLLSKQKNYSVISKDKVFDKLLKQGVQWNSANTLAYDILIENILTFYKEDTNVIVDIGLAHTPYFIDFLHKMNLDMNKVKMFLFVCSHDKIWEDRIAERILLPLGLNQSFKSVDDAKLHYGAYQIFKLSNEVEIDSALPIESMLMKITHLL